MYICTSATPQQAFPQLSAFRFTLEGRGREHAHLTSREHATAAAYATTPNNHPPGIIDHRRATIAIIYYMSVTSIRNFNSAAVSRYGHS